jgi:twitching motility protein PilT
MSKEKRASERKQLSISVTFRVIENGKTVAQSYSVLSEDLSGTGLSFTCDTFFPFNTELDASIRMPGRPVSIPCRLRIVRIESTANNKQFRIGTLYAEIDEKDRLFIAASIDKMSLSSLLHDMLKAGASNMHLMVGYAPIFRKNHELIPSPIAPIEDGQIQAMVYPLLSDAKRRAFEKNLELDFAFSPNPNERFRINLHWQKERLEAIIRNISSGLKSFYELGLPVNAMESLCLEKSGLVLIAGKVGSGKTTTLASMIHFINTHFSKVIVTVEDPIEYIFTNQKGIVKQREIGRDTRSFADALKYALRQDPDVIVVGELLDKESVQTAISAAETGHLVIATVHAGNTSQTIEKIINFFPVEHAATISKKIAGCLKGILFQVLLPSQQSGLVLASELLLKNAAVTNVITSGQLNQIQSILESGQQFGMHTLESSLETLKANGKIDRNIQI